MQSCQGRSKREDDVNEAGIEPGRERLREKRSAGLAASLGCKAQNIFISFCTVAL